MADPELDPTAPSVTRILERIAAGDDEAREALMPLVYEQLKNLARNRIRRMPAGQTLQPTVLVHEAWLRLGESSAWENRRHFFGAAARAMRNVLVDNIRGHERKKGPDGKPPEPVATEVAAPDGGATPVDVLALDEALERMERDHARQAHVVTLKYFGGLSHDEIALTMGVGARTVDRDWTFAKAWLRRAL